MTINICKRACNDLLSFQPQLKKRKKEDFFPTKGAQRPDDLCYHRFDHIPCLRENAVFVENYPLHANIIKLGKCEKEYVAAQAPLLEDKSRFWKAVFDGDYTILDLTNKTDQRKDDKRSLGIRPYYPENLNEESSLQFHTVKLIAEEGNWKKYFVKEKETKKVKEVWRFHFSEWPDYKVTSLEKLAFLVDLLIKNKKNWVHCRDGAERAGVVIAAALLHEKIAEGKIHAENFEESLKQLVATVQDQRVKSLPHDEQVELLRKYGKSLIVSF